MNGPLGGGMEGWITGLIKGGEIGRRMNKNGWLIGCMNVWKCDWKDGRITNNIIVDGWSGERWMYT